MKLLITVIVTFFAGMGAGLGTGFAGMSAAAVISPMLITFLGMDPYAAVGIALASDVLASAVSAYTYGKSKNLDIRNGIIMMATVLAFTVVGSYAASLLPSATMGSFSVIMTFLLGVKFIVRPVMTTKEAMAGVSAKKRAIQSVVCGAVIGLICGFISFRYRRCTRYYRSCALRCVYADMGEDSGGACKPRRAAHAQPRYRYRSCRARSGDIRFFNARKVIRYRRRSAHIAAVQDAIRAISPYACVQIIMKLPQNVEIARCFIHYLS